jgi:hypothetical protein
MCASLSRWQLNVDGLATFLSAQPCPNSTSLILLYATVCMMKCSNSDNIPREKHRILRLKLSHLTSFLHRQQLN